MANSLDIEYKKLNIDDCFKNHYIVPDYQREYVWENEQIEQLLSDVESAYDNNPQKPYFMGMTVVYGGNSVLELIDGQQRITTFFIILCALINIYKEHKESAQIFESRIYSPIMEADGSVREAFGLELQYSDSAECLKNIFHGCIPAEVEQVALSVSDKRLYDAYVTVKQSLGNDFPEFDELKRFAYYLFTYVQFVQIETNDVSDALKIFETINRRGVSLDSMDLLKNMIFMQVDRADFGKLNDSWKIIMDKIASIDKKPLRFLRYFITSTYDISDKTGSGILAENKIYSWLMDNEKQCGYKKNPFGFVRALTDGIDRYIRFSCPNQTDKGNDYLRNISRIAGDTYKSHLVLLLAASNMEEDILARFKQIVEAVIYYSTINKVRGNETEKIFASWCPKIRVIRSEGDLRTFVKGSVIPQVEKWKQEKDHHLNFMTLNLKTTQVYRIRFVLSRITKYVDDIRGGGVNYADISKCYDAQYQIEHIMPQKCDDPSSYGVDAEEFDYVDNLLGNLSLLEKAYNSVCNNNPYDVKCGTYRKSCFYITSSLPALQDVGKNTAANALNKKMKSWTVWNRKAIEERQEMLYALSEEIFDINNIIEAW